MGKYINKNSKGAYIGTTFEDKFSGLIDDGANPIKHPVKFQENLVILVDNGGYAAVGYMDSEQEFESFNEDLKSGTRAYRWLIYEHAKKLAL